MCSNIKTVVEEHVSSENVQAYILLVDDNDEVAMYLSSTNKLSQKPKSKLKLFKK